MDGEMDGKTFSEEQLAGQRLMVGFDVTELDRDLKFLIDTLKIGGIIIFSRNISSPDQLEDLCRSVQDYATSCDQPPLFISIDQEGGKVARLREPFTRFPGNPAMQSEADAVHFARITAAELTRIGINMNMAPVLDVAPKGVPSVMADRVFGHDPFWVSRLGIAVIEHLQHNRIIAVAKHFPGIGRTTVDSHHEKPVLPVDIADLFRMDLIPFEGAINHGVAAVMLSHILYEKIDHVWTASLSPRIANDLLRDRMGFGGITITDDLDMGSIDRHYDVRTVIQQIILANIDIALICHRGPNIEIAFQELVKTIAGSSGGRLKGRKSVERIIKLKKRFLS